MKKQIFPNCPSCGKLHDEEIFIKCKTCGYTADSTKERWKAPNMGKQRNQPKWIAENKNKRSK